VRLKLECKSDLVDVSKIVACCTYTGLKDTQIKLETKATKPQDLTCELTKTIGMATCGVKYSLATPTSADLGLRLVSGPFFGSLYAKEKFSVFTAHCYYKATSELKCAATCEYGGKKSGNFSVAAMYDLRKGTTLRAKVQQDQSIHCSLKHALAKGFNLIAGAKYDTKKSDYSYGLQISIE